MMAVPIGQVAPHASRYKRGVSVRLCHTGSTYKAYSPKMAHQVANQVIANNKSAHVKIKLGVQLGGPFRH